MRGSRGQAGGLARRWWLGLLLAAVCALLLALPGGARGDDGGRPPVVPGPGVGEAPAPDAAQLQEYLRQLNQRMDRYGVQFNLGDFAALYKPSGAGQVGGLLPALGRYLLGEVLANSRLLGQLVVLAVMAALLQKLQATISEHGAGSFAYTVVYLALAGVALTGFLLAVNAARTVVHDLASFLDAALPVLLTLLVGSGALTSAALLHPLALLLAGTVTSVVNDVVLPALMLVAALEIVSGFHPEFKLTQLAKLIRQGAVAAVSICFSLLTLLNLTKMFGGAVADGMALKAAKTAAGAIPVVGKLFADAADLVVLTATGARSALGMIGAVGVIFVVIFPLLKILSIRFIYQAAAALVQPMGGKPVVECLQTLSNNLGLLLICVAMVGLMFFLTVGAMVAASTMTFMMR